MGAAQLRRQPVDMGGKFMFLLIFFQEVKALG